MRKSIRSIAIGSVILLAVLFLGWLVLRSGSTAELAEYKAALRAKGEKLTYRELGPSLSTNGTPSTDRLVSATAGLQFGDNNLLAIGIMEYVAPGVVQVAWNQERAVLISGTEDWSVLEKRIDEAQASMFEIREALKAPDPDLGWDQKDPFNLPKDELVIKENTARWLSGAIITELHRGELERAANLLNMLYAMTEMHREEFSLITQMIRNAIAALALATTWETLQTNGWSEEQLARIQRDCERLGPLHSLEKGLLGERATFLLAADSLREEQNAGSTQNGTSMPGSSRSMSFLFRLIWDEEQDELFFLQNMQLALECVRSLMTGKPYREVQVQLAQIEAAKAEIMNSFGWYRLWQSMLSMPALNRTLGSVVQNATLRELAIAATALRRYQLRHGHLPPDLESLLPEFLDELPHDYFSGKPLIYQLNPDGTFKLYSVGTNGVDDGGDASPNVPGAEPELWKGRDAVWPGPYRESETQAEHQVPAFD